MGAEGVGSGRGSAAFIVFSGDMDKLFAAFSLATGAAAMGLEVSMFFTFWALPALRQSREFGGKSLSERVLTALLPAGPGGLRTSKLQCFGLGRLLLRSMMRQHQVATLPELMATARKLKVRMIVCETAMSLVGIRKAELIDGLEYAGVASFLEGASNAKMTLFV